MFIKRILFIVKISYICDVYQTSPKINIMKSAFRKSILSIVFSLICMFTSAQNWDWYHKPYDTISQSWFTISHHDKQNNYYVFGHYYDTILFPDTAFIHSNNVQGLFEAVVKYNDNGSFLGACDIYTLANDIIINSQMVTNSNGEIFISGGFQQVAYVNGYEIFNGDSVSYWYPDVYLVKMDKDFNIIWADIIGGRFQDDLLDIDLTEDENIVITTDHYGQFNYFLSQDTTYYDTPFVSITLLDDEKDIIWRKDIIGNISGHTTVGEDQNIHFFGRAWGDFVIDGDTIHHPNDEPYPPSRNISINFQPDGKIINVEFLDFDLLFSEALFNENGELYVNSKVKDTVLFQNDTLIGNEYGSNAELIVKMNSDFEVEWYKFFEIPEGSNFHFSFLPIQLRNNHIFIALSTDNDFSINDELISSERPIKSFFTEIDESGNLLWTKILEGDFRIRVADIVLDNCENIFFNLFYNGNVFFDNDTIITNTSEYYDDLFAKLTMKPTNVSFLGPDTTACDSIIISVPNEYSSYIWNDSLLEENEFLVKKTGDYHIAIGDDENCWQYDTIQVQIDEGFMLDLGSDTSIFGNDTIYFSVSDELEEYLWSDGSSTNQLEIIGNNYGLGQFTIWLQANKGACSSSDTILLRVDGGFGLDEILNQNLQLFPIPTSENLHINLNKQDDLGYIYQIVNEYGQKVKQGSIHSANQLIILNELKPGIYLLSLFSKNEQLIITKKFIKN